MALQELRRPRGLAVIAAVLVCAAGAFWSYAQEGESRELLKKLAAEATHGPAYTVTELLVDFAPSVASHPSLEEVLALEVNLGVAASGYTDPEESPKYATVKLSDLGQLQNPKFHASAVKRICQRIGAYFGEQGLAGLEVAAHEQDIDEHGRDLRGKEQTALRLTVSGEESKVESPKPEARNPKPAASRPAAKPEAEPQASSPALSGGSAVIGARKSGDEPTPAPKSDKPLFVEVKEEKPAQAQAGDAKEADAPSLGGGAPNTDNTPDKDEPHPAPTSGGALIARDEQNEEVQGSKGPTSKGPEPETAASRPAAKPGAETAAKPETETEPAPAPESVPDPQPPISDPTYTVSQFLVAFDPNVPSRPPIKEVMSYPIQVSDSPTGYTAPVEGGEVIKVKLGEVQAKLGGKPWHLSAIKAACASVNMQLEVRGFPKLRVIINEDDVNSAGEDVRAQNQTAMRLYVEPRAAQPEPPQVAKVEPKPTPEPAKPVEPANSAALRPAAKPKTETKPEVEPAPTPEPAPQVAPAPAAAPQVPTPAPHVPAQPTAPRVTTFVEAAGADGRAYPVSQVIIEYARKHAENPNLHEILEYVGTHLAETPEGFIAAEPGSPSAKFVRVVDLPLMGNPRLFASAIQAYSKSIAKVYVDRGFVGIRVAPHPEDIAGDLKDLRTEGISALRLVVTLGEVRRLRTVGVGPRIESGQEPVNNPIHRRILSHAPIKGSDAAAGTRGDLLQRKEVDDYARRLSRHPGRNVTVGVTPDATSGGTALDIDLFVAEAKPWNLYAQISNTGTEQTNEWRQRFGFVHNQLSNADDILRIDYITSSFDDQHALLASYEAPLFDFDRLRWRVSGLYSMFTASDVGAAGVDFDGDEQWLRGDVIANVYQNDNLFIDLFAGARYQQDRVDINAPGFSEGSESFIIPHVGVQLERFSTTSRTFASVQYEMNMAGADDDELSNMGRLLNDPATGDFIGEEDFGRATWEAYHSFYLEPLFYTPGVDAAPQKSLLAHELFFNFRGQYSSDRNIPQFQRTVGGFQSVRGYDEAAGAGDTALIFTAEYRFHVPHAFCFDKPGELLGKPFRHAPSQVYGGTDWDLILRAFFDYAKVYNNDVPTVIGGTELDEFEMASVGVGAELLFKGNLSLRVDYGYVLQEVQGIAEEGDSRIHFAATFVY